METDISVEKGIAAKIAGAFPQLEGKLEVTRQRRIFGDIPSDIFIDVIGYVKNELGFTHLCTITGLDLGDHLQFIYHVANDPGGIVINLKLTVPKADPVAKTVTPVYNGAIYYERELESMLGAKIEGLPAGRRYPVTDDWPEGEYPLRKDWKPGMSQTGTADANEGGSL